MKKTLIVLLAALVLLAAILLKKLSDDRSLQKDVPALDSTRKAEVTAFKVIKKSDTSMLAKKDGKWLVGKDEFPADTAKVNKVLRYVFGLQTKELVSTSAARVAEYGLDSNEAKHITMSDASGKLSVAVVVGKTSGADYSSTYWRWESKPDVYRTPGNFTWEIGTKEDEWKERKLFAAQAKDVKFVETNWKDTTGMVYHYKLEATSDSTWKMLEPQDSNWVKKTIGSDMASRFADMAIDDFVNSKDTNAAVAKLDSPTVWIKVGLKNGTMQELKVGKAIGGFSYAQHPSRKDIIKLSTWRFDAFKKKPFEILDAPPVKADTSKAAQGSTPAGNSSSVAPTSAKPVPVATPGAPAKTAAPKAAVPAKPAAAPAKPAQAATPATPAPTKK